MAPVEARDPVAIALAVGSLLDSLEVPYLVAGSLASSAHGEPRSTLDVDLVAALTRRTARLLTRALATDYYVDPAAADDAVTLAGSFNAVHLATAIKVDVFVAGNDAFEAERLRLRQQVQLGTDPGATLWIDTAEHTLLRKLEWYRRGGEVSERQWRDAEAIVRIQGERLDRARLAHWGKHLGVSDLLDRLEVR